MISRICTFPSPNYDDLTPEEKQKFGKMVNQLREQGYAGVYRPRLRTFGRKAPRTSGLLRPCSHGSMIAPCCGAAPGDVLKLVFIKGWEVWY